MIWLISLLSDKIVSSSVHSMIIPPAGADIMRERQKEAALYPHLEDSLTGQHQFQKSVWSQKNQEDIHKYLKSMGNISNKKEID